jgi:hypothetical protein
MKINLISKDKNHFKFNNFAPLLWKLQNDKGAHHVIKDFPMIPKNGMGGLHNLGKVQCDHIQVNKHLFNV